MSNELALNTFLQEGLQQKELANFLASNVVLDWFGRSFLGKQKVSNFYFTSNNSYIHEVANTKTVEPFEERSLHLLTRHQPIDNKKSLDLTITGTEQWFDCETHSPIDLKQTLQTPPRKSISTPDCPAAPMRNNINQNSDDDNETSETSEDDDDGEDEFLGVRPIDSSIEIFKTKKQTRISHKRLRRYSKEDTSSKMLETIPLNESKYSNLHYLETSGFVSIFRQSTSATPSNEYDRRECKLLISYRINKENPSDIQIALIVYKPNGSNTKSRRNLMLEFSARDLQEIKSTSSTPIISRPNTALKEFRTTDEVFEIATDPVGKMSKGIKRPMMSRNRLRF